MDKRYTVFVSSTYADLKEERDAVIRAIMEAGHIPLGMEAFGAANVSQWEIITDTINSADYYVLILGARYGSINDATKISFTEMEFDYAVSQDVPCLVLTMDAEVRVDPRFVDDPKNLDLFKNKAMHNRQSAFWKNSDDLASKVMRALTAEFRRSPRDGWVRPSPMAGPGVAEEIARLSQENEELRRERSISHTFGGGEVDQVLRAINADTYKDVYIRLVFDDKIRAFFMDLISLFLIISEVEDDRRGISFRSSMKDLIDTYAVDAQDQYKLDLQSFRKLRVYTDKLIKLGLIIQGKEIRDDMSFIEFKLTSLGNKLHTELEIRGKPISVFLLHEKNK